MFKITPVQDIGLASKYLSDCNATVKEGCFVYAMTDCDSGNLMGVSQFEILSEYAYIYDLKSIVNLNDFEAMFILGRQTMNFINSCGIELCRSDLNAGDEQLIKSIGFEKKFDYYECNTHGMFDGSHCSGHTQK